MTATITDNRPHIGEGAYTVPDISKILGVKGDKIRRWANGYNRLHQDGGRIKVEARIDHGAWGENRERGLNFLAMIELYVFHVLRELGYPMQKINNDRNELIQRFQTAYPFASHELLCDGKCIHIPMENAADRYLMTLGTKGQTSFRKIVSPFCKCIDFSEHTSLAERYWPLGRKECVIVDPHHGFGRPTINGTNISTETIASLIQAGEATDDVADDYLLSEKEIKSALKFEFRNVA